jgi:hypothetical protein
MTDCEKIFAFAASLSMNPAFLDNGKEGSAKAAPAGAFHSATAALAAALSAEMTQEGFPSPILS